MLLSGKSLAAGFRRVTGGQRLAAQRLRAKTWSRERVARLYLGLEP